MFTPAGNEKEMDGISAGEVMEEPARDFRIPASEIHPRLFYSNDLRLRREGGRIDTFKQHHSSRRVWGEKKCQKLMRRTENVKTAGDTSRVPPSLTKEPVQPVANSHRGEWIGSEPGASDITTSSCCSSHGVC